MRRPKVLRRRSRVNGPNPRITLFGELGSGNMGNDGSARAVIAALQEFVPQAHTNCICRGPEAAAREFGIDALPMINRKDNPRWPRLYKLFVRVPGKLVDVAWMIRVLRGTDVVVVPGAGVFESSSARPFGLPYSLFCMTLAARIRGIRIVYLSVGADIATSRLTRWFIRFSAQNSDYCSFRDDLSRNAMLQLHGANAADAVIPDIAFTLRPTAPVAMARESVGIGLISATDWRGSSSTQTEKREAYLRDMTTLALTLIKDGRNVVLLTGDRSDDHYAIQVEAAVRARTHAPDSDRIQVSPAVTLQDLVNSIASLELAIVARYHNIVCSLAQAKPTLALAYAPKTTELMAEFGLRDFAVPFQAVDIDRIVALYRRLWAERDAIHGDLTGVADRVRHLVELQRDALESVVLGNPPRPPRTHHNEQQVGGAG